MAPQPSYWKVLTRRKQLHTEGADGETKLNRVLGLFDLTALGVGSTLGAGVYVLAGQIARDQAGPSVMLSFAIAALASLLAGVCYAEFGARVPKAGSAYVYSYVCIGEFAAFVIGWNLMLEYIIGTASVCRGISLYLDTLINDTFKTTFAEVAPINVSFLASYFDFFAFALVIVFGVALAFGVETSTWANNFCTCLNIFILLFVIIAGAIKANFENWTVDVSTIDTNSTTNAAGSGGYFPFGFTGTLKGAATCFFGFVGFDCIATTGEEVRNPRKNIPRSILLSLLIIFLCYFGVSTVLTLMVPYYQQDANAPLPYAFKAVGWPFAMWIVAIGGVIGLVASLFGALFPLPRVMYSMAEDGLLFRFLGKINARFRVPVVGSIFAAVFTALMAGLFDLAQLVNLLSIGTLLAYSVVAISVTILRYMDNSDESDRENGNQPLSENSMLTSTGTRVTFTSVLLQLFNCKRLDVPNSLSTRIVGTLITLFCLFSVGIGVILTEAYDALISNQLWVLILLPVLVALTLLVLLAICLQPREAYTRIFRVPFVPIVPAISIFLNIYLMLQLDVMTWIRFGIWMAIGLPMYIACWCMYDIKNHEKRNPARVAFERALKASAKTNRAGHNNGQLANHIEANGALKSTKGANGINGTVLTTQNEHTVKSLDEIMDLNEVSDELIEMKHPNGKIFYVEDDRSHKSLGSDKDESAKATHAEASEDAKFVIALLDDVLRGEDDGTPATPHIQPDYSRKVSVDSEMLPSVIESTTVATVHSSSNSSDEYLDVLPEVESKHSDGSSNASLDGSVNRYVETQQVAQKLVEEILNDEKLLQAMEQHRQQTASAVESNVDETKIVHAETIESEAIAPASVAQATAETATNAVLLPLQPAEKFKRSNSEASLLSTASIEDPMHSEKFKNKLSKIIMQAPPPISTLKRQKEPAPVAESNAPLKQSRSENDMRQLVLRAIEGAGMQDVNADANGTAADGIPKPPKFDPILYQTINSLRTDRARPSLKRLLQQEEETSAARATAASSEQAATGDEPIVPFKLRLEAALKRGPSHRTQQRPEAVLVRRPKSMEPVHLEFAEQASERNLSATPELEPNPVEAINKVRNSLRHVSNGPVLL